MKLIKNLITIAKNVLLNEAEAIKSLTEEINEDFENCILEILKCKGRVVVTGIGKSAIIGSKIVATLNSTGTPALFMHAADAIHGDIGMIMREDIVICISKSGNTSEIKVLVPLLKRAGNQLIALVGNKDSYLALHSNYVLNATVAQEACPHNLAPTTSTTAALALGDAVAICLLEARDFSSSDFANLHPGGSLGKKLYLKVKDVFPNNPLPSVLENAAIKEVIMEISSKRLGATAVVGKDGSLKGIITDGDLRRMLNKYDNISHIYASEIMNPYPKIIGKEDYAVKGLQVMQEKNITQLVVVEEEKPIGFIHLHDLLKEGIV
jgi:arabinose-5-phosphate isomerase